MQQIPLKAWLRNIGKGLVVLCFIGAVVWRFAWPWTNATLDWIFIGLAAVGLLLVFVFRVFD